MLQFFGTRGITYEITSGQPHSSGGGGGGGGYKNEGIELFTHLNIKITSVGQICYIHQFVGTRRSLSGF